MLLHAFPFPTLSETVLEVSTALVQSDRRLFRHADANSVDAILKTERAAQLIFSLKQGQFGADALQFVEFLTALVDAEDLYRPDYATSHRLDDVLSILMDLLICPGAAAVEDQVIQPILGTFNAIAEGFCDWLGSTDNAVEDKIKAVIRSTCFACVRKACFPHEQMVRTMQTWDTDDRTKFHDFRHDVQDFLLSAFSILGPSVLHEIILNNHGQAQESWESFEARLYCLGGFADMIESSYKDFEQAVSAVLNAPKWRVTLHETVDVPDRARQGVLNFIAKITGHLQRRQQDLLPCLNFLFSSLRNSGSVSAASRAIQTLCYSQRSMLVMALPNFIHALKNVEDIAPEDRHRIFSAVAAVIQALPTEVEKITPLSQVLTMVAEASNCVQESVSLDYLDYQDTLRRAIDLLETLVSIGRGLRAPPESPINLELDRTPAADIWRSGPGKKLQDVALDILNTTMATANFRFDGQVIEAACDIFRSGYSEQDPSPFRFPPDASARFISSVVHLSTPNLNVVASTASAFLASYLSSPDSIIAEFALLLKQFCEVQRTLLSTYQTAGKYSDHEFTYTSLDFFTRLLPTYGSIYFSLPNLEDSNQTLFEFAILALENPDTLPRRSSAAFWAAFFDFGAYYNGIPPEAVFKISLLLHTYTERFTALLLRLLGGECARSELDVLAEPLKKFVGKHGLLAQKCLNKAIEENFGALSSRALAATTFEQRKRLVAQIMG